MLRRESPLLDRSGYARWLVALAGKDAAGQALLYELEKRPFLGRLLMSVAQAHFRRQWAVASRKSARRGSALLRTGLLGVGLLPCRLSSPLCSRSSGFWSLGALGGRWEENDRVRCQGGAKFWCEPFGS
jgi:hypothetical protein